MCIRDSFCGKRARAYHKRTRAFLSIPCPHVATGRARCTSARQGQRSSGTAGALRQRDQPVYLRLQIALLAKANTTSSQEQQPRTSKLAAESGAGQSTNDVTWLSPRRRKRKKKKRDSPKRATKQRHSVTDLQLMRRANEKCMSC